MRTLTASESPLWFLRTPYFLGALSAAFILRLLLIFYAGNLHCDTGRMIPLYDLGANLADTGQLWQDTSYVRGAFSYLYRTGRRENIDYKDMVRLIRPTRAYQTNPHITDTWGYPVLLGALWKITGYKSFIMVQFFQVVLDCLALVVCALMILYVFKTPRCAWCVAWAYALFVPFAFLTVLPNRDYFAAWGALFSCAGVIMAPRASRPWLWCLGAGFAVALFSWFRATIFLLPVWYALWLLWQFPRHSLLRRVVYAFLPGIVTVFFFVVPFSAQYHHRYGTWSFSAGITGPSLWEGLGRFSDKYHFRYNDVLAYNRAVELGYPAGEPAWTPAFGRLLKEDALSVIRADPLFYFAVMARRYVRFFFARPPMVLSEKYWVSYEESALSVTEFVRRHPVLFIEKSIKTICAYVLPLGALAVFFLVAPWRNSLLLLLGIWQYRLLVGTPIHLEDRYVMECYFPVVVVCALGCCRLVSSRFFGKKGRGKPCIP